MATDIPEITIFIQSSDLDVDLGSGNLVVKGDGFSDGAVKAAVEAAGLSLAVDAFRSNLASVLAG